MGNVGDTLLLLRSTLFLFDKFLSKAELMTLASLNLLFSTFYWELILLTGFLEPLKLCFDIGIKFEVLRLAYFLADYCWLYSDTWKPAAPLFRGDAA